VNKNLLVVANTPSANTKRLAQAIVAGARNPEITSVSVRHLQPLAATAEDVYAADGLILGTTENFGYMSGALKDFFDRIYYPVLETKQGTPYALYVRAGLDGSGTLAAVQRIVTGLRWLIWSVLAGGGGGAVLVFVPGVSVFRWRDAAAVAAATAAAFAGWLWVRAKASAAELPGWLSSSDQQLGAYRQPCYGTVVATKKEERARTVMEMVWVKVG